MERGFLLPSALTAAALAGPLTLGLMGGCGRSSVELNVTPDAGADADAMEEEAAPPPITTTDKVDLLLVVDNSPNTDVAHQVLADTVPYLLDRLIHPACVNGLGNVVGTPIAPGTCTTGVPDFAPVDDLHVAVISTSLGGHGADICSPKGPQYSPAQNDAAHLLSRLPGGAGAVPTYLSQGFLAWDPSKKLSPPGETNETTLANKLVEMIQGAGSSGCGFESQLESLYRFLVEPNPYLSIAVQAGKAIPSGTDAVVLQNRADFLRPDSALVVVLVTDENDCSTREGGQYYLSNQGANPGATGIFHLPRARSECEKDPLDKCCASCGQATPAGCSPSASDPQCLLPPMDGLEDPVNLRCFDQKRRFGVDFLYPVDRYVDGLTKTQIADRDGNVVDNPLFTGNRSPELVLFGAIVGVPWQDLAKDPKSLATGFAPPSEIDWSLVVGDPATGALPKDALMIESIAPRLGTSPRAGVDLAPADAPLPTSNPINGHERVIATADDLQYACIYPRQAPKDCTGGGCECEGSTVPGNPICQQADGTYSTVQTYARALPGIRELRVVEGLGDRAAVGSVCAAITAGGGGGATFGYKPAVDAVLRAVRRKLPSGS